MAVSLSFKMTGIYPIMISLMIVVLLTPYVSAGKYSIKCWSCDSTYDRKCAEPFDNSTIPITDCEQEKGKGPPMCLKKRQKVNGEWSYVRSCAYLGEEGIQDDEKSCLKLTGTDNLIEYCTCKSKDLCNSSYMSTPSYYMLGLLLGVSSLLNFFLVLK